MSPALWHDAAMADAAPGLESAFQEHRGFLWGLSYRLVGDAADAEEIVQEAFVRALAHPPADTTQPWRPWLTRVALNLGRDVLRRRRRRGYTGPWLPSPVATDDHGLTLEARADPAQDPAARYDRLESVTFAFLLALEALSPAQRAVLLLRDVFDYSVRETAEALKVTEAGVKTTHLRARRTMAGYDRERLRPGPELAARTRAMLERFMTGLMQGDTAGVEATLAADVRGLVDSAGQFPAAKAALVGPATVARVQLGVSSRVGKPSRVEWRSLNGMPAVVMDLPDSPPGWAPRVVLFCELDAAGRIRSEYVVAATRKLVAIG